MAAAADPLAQTYKNRFAAAVAASIARQAAVAAAAAARPPDVTAAEAAALLLTADDVTSMYSLNDAHEITIRDNGTAMYDVTTTIPAKIISAIPTLRRPHVIQCVAYPTVYFSSDIHADVRKFIQMLRAVGLASMPVPVLDPYTPDIYDPRMISEVQWTGGRGTVLVIVGDLVDGKRGASQVDDPRGSFELLLLCYLYNLRIQARKNGSEVLYTIGNHDYLSIVTNSDDLDGYIHLSALNDEDDSFFATSAQRKNALRTFYALNPFFMLSFMNGAQREVACVHGGLQNETGSLADALELYQSTIDTKMTRGEIEMSLENLPAVLSVRSSALRNYMDGGAIWTRFYVYDADGKCGPGVLASTYPLIIVGHCPTDSSVRSRRIMTENPARYPGCSVGGPVPGLGCVVTDCDTAHGPRLAFVDTTMSQAFHGADSSGRYAQFLKLTHTETPSARYYNKIESVTANPVAVESRVLYDAAAPVAAAAAPVAVAAAPVAAPAAPLLSTWAARRLAASQLAAAASRGAPAAARFLASLPRPAAPVSAMGGAGGPVDPRRGRKQSRGGGYSTRKRHMRSAGGASTRRRHHR